MKSKKRPKSKTGNLQRPAKNHARKTMKKAAAPRRPAVKRSSAKMRKSKSRSGARSYTTATIKELFALCSNQCAFPDCPNVIVTPGTQVSKAAVLGHICHIYAASDNGPRGKPGLTEKERNAPGNLILMCGHHHPLVDKQWETYPAVELKKWKQLHEAKAMPGTAEAIKRTVDIEKHVFFEQVSDEQIEKALARIRRGRFLVGFPTVEETQRLATQVEQSRYSSGSAVQRARALAWCARLLAQDATMARALELLRESIEIQMTPEGSLAQAFITAATDPPAALASLAIMNTPVARSAALRIVTTKSGVKKRPGMGGRRGGLH